MRRVGSVSVPSRYLSRPGAASPHGRLPARCRPSAPQGAAPPCAAGREEPGQPREPGTGRDRAGSGGIERDRAEPPPHCPPGGPGLRLPAPSSARRRREQRGERRAAQARFCRWGWGWERGGGGSPRGRWLIQHGHGDGNRWSLTVGWGLGTVLGGNRAAEVRLFRS